MFLPKLIADKIEGYLYPPYVFMMTLDYRDIGGVKIYDTAHAKKMVKDMFDMCGTGSKMNISNSRGGINETAMTVNNIVLEYGKNWSSPTSIEIFENVSKFPYNLLLDKKHKKFCIEFHYKEIDMCRSGGYARSVMWITKKPINN